MPVSRRSVLAGLAPVTATPSFAASKMNVGASTGMIVDMARVDAMF